MINLYFIDRYFDALQTGLLQAGITTHERLAFSLTGIEICSIINKYIFDAKLTGSFINSYFDA